MEQSWSKFIRIHGDHREKYDENPPNNYTDFEAMIKECMNIALDKISIKSGQYKPKLIQKAKTLKEEKRRARKEFELASPEDKL